MDTYKVGEASCDLEPFNEKCFDMNSSVKWVKNLYVPYNEGIVKAKQALENKNDEALEVSYKMGQCLIALDDLGYKVVKK